MDGKSALLEFLRARRADLLAKLDGLGEYDVRRPMTPTGTNLLGLVKHVSYVQLGYFGEVFGRPSGRSYPWDAEGAEEGVDLWAAPEETRADVLERYAFAAAHADATIGELPLDATGTVPWWREERRHPTLHTVLVHVGGEVARHAGHADVLRELIDGSAGVSSPGDNLPERSAAGWAAFRERIEAAARQAAGLPTPSGAPPGDG
jgi:uncharacterized protein DUF664